MTAVTDPMASMLSTCTTHRSWAEQDEGPYHLDAQPLRRYLAAICLVLPTPESVS